MKRALALLVAMGVMALAAPQEAQAQYYRGGSGFGISVGSFGGGYGGFNRGFGGYNSFSRGGFNRGFGGGYSSFRPSYSYGRSSFGGYGGGYRGGYRGGCGY